MADDHLEEFQAQAHALGLELHLISFDPWTVMGLALESDGSTSIEFWRAELRRGDERVLFEVRDTAGEAAEAALAEYAAQHPA